ncbi:MAG: hypothetical protein FJ009_14735 [Chloroflexi bacterium]|nr:hypothetical protein [Chloroflexota bacterium]
MQIKHLTGWTILTVVSFALAACATSEVRDQRTEVSTLTPTASLAPPVTPSPTAAPTFTATLPPTATATPTRTAAQARAAQLYALAGYTWRADGDAIMLTDAKGARVATLDEKAGGVLRVDSDGAAAFTALDAVSKQRFLQANSENVRFIQTSFHTDAKNQPQAAVVEWLTKDGVTSRIDWWCKSEINGDRIGQKAGSGKAPRARERDVSAIYS